MSKKIVILTGLLIFVFIFSSPVSARQRRVLGTATGSAAVQIPPTTEGPGLILPDSPFFFLDKLKQATRLFFAFTPEAKAKVHTQVAGERLAELRFMLAKQNVAGIETDLKGISSNLQSAANDLAQAQLSGRDVKTLAKTINDDVKRKQETLDLLENQAQGELKAQVAAVQASLVDSKVRVEDALPANELENEIRDDLNRQIGKRVKEASDSARELKDDLDELHKEASEAAKNSLKKREEALKEAIEKKNEVLKKAQEKFLEAEKKKQEDLLRVQEKAVEQAKAAIEKAQEAAAKFQEIQKEANKIQQSTGGSSEASGGGGSQSSGSGGGASSGSSGGGSSSNTSSGGDHGGSSGGGSGGGGGDHGGGKD
ncbi:MAG: DUF5667 domain-containing protein [Patescibacteria group bacterium]|nr:DUF5667 domain-containing protein [Patescibacteria group bacterium]